MASRMANANRQPVRTSTGADSAEGPTQAVARIKPVDAAVLFNGPRVATTAGLAEFLGGLMVDLRNGDADVKTAAVVSDVAGKLLKAMELQHRISRSQL